MQKNKKQIKILLVGLIVLLFVFMESKFFTKTELVISESVKRDFEIKFIPEYKRTAEKVLLTISSQKQNNEFEKLLERTYGELLKKFPSYTEFEIITSEKNFRAVENLIEKKQLSQRVLFRKIKDAPIEPWAQDYFEPAISDEGETIFLFPKKELLVNPERASLRNTERNYLNSKITEGRKVIETGFFFEGGNIIITEDPNSQESLALIDYTNIADSLTKENNSPVKIANLLSEEFGGVKVAVIGNMQRKDNLIHLDQSVLFLPQNFVLLNKITGFPKNSAANQHETYKKQLEQLGFKIIEIKTSMDAVRKSQSSLNAIIFFDKNENKEKLIYPVFEDEIVSSSELLLKENLRGNALQIYKALEKLDIHPIPLLDQDLFQNNAGYHCLVNILK